MPDVLPADLLASQTEGDVLEHVEVWEQCVGLEDRVDVATVRREVGHVAPTEVDRPEGRILEAADHAERGRLPATRRPQEAEELALRDVEGQVVDGGDIPEELGDALQPNVDLGHGNLLQGSARSRRPPDRAAAIIT